jgi:hypothetical protein
MKKLGLFFFITLIYPQRFAIDLTADPGGYSAFSFNKKYFKPPSVHKTDIPVSKFYSIKSLERSIATHRDNFKSHAPSKINLSWMGETVSIRRDLAFIRRELWKGETIVSEMGSFYIIQQEHIENSSWPYVVENQYGEYYGFHPKIRFKPSSAEERSKFEDDYGLELEQEIESLKLVYYKVDRLSPERVLHLANNTQIKPELVKILRR